MDKELYNLNTQTHSDTSWSMGVGYYDHLLQFKKLFTYFYTNKMAEELLLCVHNEYLHVYPYLLDEKYQDKLVEVEQNFLIVEKLVYARVLGAKADEVKSNNFSKALKLLASIERDLYVIQASKGMLQPKKEDFVQSLRKYGD